MKRYDNCIKPDGMCGSCPLSTGKMDCHDKKINSVLYNRSVMGMTQKELSEKAGINIRQIQKYESGEYDTGNMTLKNAVSLAHVLKCRAEDLL